MINENEDINKLMGRLFENKKINTLYDPTI